MYDKLCVFQLPFSWMSWMSFSCLKMFWTFFILSNFVWCTVHFEEPAKLDSWMRTHQMPVQYCFCLLCCPRTPFVFCKKKTLFWYNLSLLTVHSPNSDVILASEKPSFFNIWCQKWDRGLHIGEVVWSSAEDCFSAGEKRQPGWCCRPGK